MKKYYVYVRPGYIEYFDDFEDACAFADEYGFDISVCTVSDDKVVYVAS